MNGTKSSLSIHMLWPLGVRHSRKNVHELAENFHRQHFKCLWVFTLRYQHEVREERVSSFDNTTGAGAGCKPSQQPPESLWLWRQNPCEEKKMWNWVIGINSSSVSCYSTKHLHGFPLPDSEIPEAEIAGSRGVTGCRSSTSEANPTVLHNDICSPGSIPRW